jgi:twitching motility protein PilT
VMTSAQWATLEKEREFDGSLSLDDGTRFRLNVFFQKEFPAAALRLIPYRIPDAETLGIPEALLRLAFRPQGLLLITGPTGSGKTTSVACLVDAVNRGRACHIITVEDPIEYYHESHSSTIDQRQVESDTLSFKSALKYALRQDPDVLVVGEMRDTETIQSALTAAETGHLVLATLHTNDACQTVDRIVDVFPPHQQAQIRQQVAASLLAVVSQRLLPRSDGNGRIAAFELMIATPAIRNLIREGKTHQIPNVIATSTSTGMRTLEKSLTELYRSGLVSYEEAARYFTEKSAPTEAPR